MIGILAPACSQDKPLNTGNDTVAAAPTGLALVGTATSARIDLTWIDSSDNEFEFRIQRSTDNINFTQVGTALMNTQNYSDFGLQPSKTYYYKVIAWNSRGDSVAAGPLTVATAGLAWTTGVSGGPSLGRANHSAVYDDSGPTPRMLVYGGFDANSGTFSNELWSLPLPLNTAPGAWSNPATLGFAVPGLLGHSAVVDSAHQKMVVFGGQYMDSMMNILYSNEVYVLDLATMTWSNPAPTGTPPSARAFHVASYDPTRKQMIVHGGYDATFELADTYVLNLATAGSFSWSGPLSGIKPLHRQQHAGICDPVNDQVIIFGGIDNDATADNSPLNQDSWSLSTAPPLLWTPMTFFSGIPDKTSGHSAIYDEANRRMLIFAGQNTNDPVPFINSDIWEMTLEGTPSWRILLPTNLPAARYGHSAVYDRGNGRMVIYGGYNAVLNVFDNYCTIKL